MSVCGKKKAEPEYKGDSPYSISPSSSQEHEVIEMETPPDVQPPPPMEDKPATPTKTAPVSGGKRVQTPVTPIRGAGPEPTPTVVSAKQEAQEAIEDKDDFGLELEKSSEHELN